jgi:thioredoxin reductase (NADPH)
MTKSLDTNVLIIGGGPAGIAAALWCSELGLGCVLLERSSELGGQLLWTHNPIGNYPGVNAANGRELRDLFLRNIEKRRMAVRLGSRVTSIDTATRQVTLADNETLCADDLIIATGVRRTSLDIPGEKEFRGRGVLASGSLAKPEVAGKRVVIVGGGDAALENALILSDVAAKVWVVHRRHQYSAREEFLSQAAQRSNIEFLGDTRLTAIRGDTTVRSVEIESASSGDGSVLECDAVLIRIGVKPNTGLLAGQVQMDDRGYITVDAEGLTSSENVYAVGDVAHPSSPTLSTAVGSGATAIKSLFARRR